MNSTVVSYGAVVQVLLVAMFRIIYCVIYLLVNVPVVDVRGGWDG